MARRRSIGGPITVGVAAAVLTLAMLVAWILVLVRNRALTQEVVGNTWLMVGGIFSFAVIIAVLVLFTVFLVREIREVRRQDTFIDSVTHELKSPLASLQLALETMGRRKLDAERSEQLRAMMLDDVSRLSGLIDGVLVASRLAVERKKHGRERIVVHEMVERSVDAVTRRQHVDRDAVLVDVAEDLVLTTDRASLRLIFDNLLDNALKYSGDAPEVVVRVRSEPTQVSLEVQDAGIGIARSDLKRVFARFYRVPEENVRERHGTGLGLFVVQSMARNLGGKVEADSEGPGKGATFRVSLPARLAELPEELTELEQPMPSR